MASPIRSSRRGLITISELSWEGFCDQLDSLLRRQIHRREVRKENSLRHSLNRASNSRPSGPALGQDIDTDKKSVRRKRSTFVDTVGLLLAVAVSSGSVQDSTTGREVLIEKVAVEHPMVRKI
ncbi:hypothetical protein [Streptomyces bobili]|uniref:hypothetical protein n=1 Tax=Streptomyces bobili TaxID=67280 RepID=UPI0038082F66